MNFWIINPFDDLPNEGVRPGRYWSLAETLVRRGHNVVWWSSSYSHRFKQHRSQNNLDGLGIEFRIVRTRPYHRNISMARLANHYGFARGFYHDARLLLAGGLVGRPDCMVVSLPPLSPAGYALKLRQEYGGRVVVDIQDAWPETFYRLIPGDGGLQTTLANIVFRPWRRQAEHAYNGADAITGVAQSYVRLALASRPEVPHHMTPIGAILKEIDRHRNFIDDRGNRHRRYTFAYLGSMSSNYDLATVIHAAHRLRSNGYSLGVIMAGMGPDERRLVSLVESLQLTDVVEFKGFLDYPGVVKVLSAANVALNPILPESFSALPNKIGDYLGAGLPVISSIPGECRDLLQTHDCGTFYEAGDVSALYEAMVRYLDNPTQSARQGQNARHLAETMFDRDRTYPEWAEFLERLVGDE